MNIQQFFHQYFYPVYIRRWAERFHEVEGGQIVVDAGSYLGGFTFYTAKKVGKAGKVIAFEPDPRNFEVLKKSVDNSKLENIILINKALGNTVKKVELESANHFSSVVIKTSKRLTFEIQQTTLDQELKNFGIFDIDFIKINIEGAEVDALKGATKTLLNTKHIVISCHIINGINTADIVESMLKKCGFRVEVLKRRKVLVDFGHIDVYGFRYITK
ncbi:hypothetical protein A3G68_06830, partial [Candidatus Gottesmanbacteria bacterium RIFCSPLOWO2_12_FULL_42_10]